MVSPAPPLLKSEKQATHYIHQIVRPEGGEMGGSDSSGAGGVDIFRNKTEFRKDEKGGTKTVLLGLRHFPFLVPDIII